MNRREFLTAGLGAAATLPLGATVVPLDSKKFPSVLKETGSDAMRGRGPLISARPYVQLLEENEVGVVWTTSRLATGYAEWKQEGTDWQTCWMENDGFLSANKLIHKAVLSGFDPKEAAQVPCRLARAVEARAVPHRVHRRAGVGRGRAQRRREA